ncbi:hypothetical protein F5876DRAFT_73321 [Lentinula aff. lateritia]|uniref:Uncharacterized protein n=1 Tax=Lentinula aff. lateritia TaxID=2804960 RepID=A0ACC1UA86_9AGAR|nr:hypothetical protein F5876DRAFT_73321 [Lentinula aff. lateritia]
MDDLPVDIFDVLLGEFCEPEDVRKFLKVSYNARIAADKIIFHTLKLTDDISKSGEQLRQWQAYDRTHRFTSSPRILHIPAFHILGHRTQYNAFIANFLSISSIRQTVTRLILEFSHPTTLALFLRPEFSFPALSIVQAHIPWYLFAHSVVGLASLVPGQCIESVAVHGSMIQSGSASTLALPAVALPPGDSPVSVKRLLLPYARSSQATYPHIPRAVVSGRLNLRKLSTFIVEINEWWEDRDVALILSGMEQLEKLIINARDRPSSLNIIQFPLIHGLREFGYNGNVSFYNQHKKIVYVSQAVMSALHAMQCHHICHLYLDIFYNGPTTVDDDLESNEVFEWRDLSSFLGERQSLQDIHFNYWLNESSSDEFAQYHADDVNYYITSSLLRQTLVYFHADTLSLTTYLPPCSRNLQDFFDK